jgi:hypothetical protein
MDHPVTAKQYVASTVLYQCLHEVINGKAASLVRTLIQPNLTNLPAAERLESPGSTDKTGKTDKTGRMGKTVNVAKLVRMVAPAAKAEKEE